MLSSRASWLTKSLCGTAGAWCTATEPLQVGAAAPAPVLPLLKETHACTGIGGEVSKGCSKSIHSGGSHSEQLVAYLPSFLTGPLSAPWACMSEGPGKVIEKPWLLATSLKSEDALAFCRSYLFLFRAKEDIVVYLWEKTLALGLHLVQA